VCLTEFITVNRDLLDDLEKSPHGNILWSAKDGAPGEKGVHTSPVMEAVNADLKRRFPHIATRGLPCVLWSDGTALTHRLSGHPANLKVANVSPELYHKRVCAHLVWVCTHVTIRFHVFIFRTNPSI
jgi:hypothetical protein